MLLFYQIDLKSFCRGKYQAKFWRGNLCFDGERMKKEYKKCILIGGFMILLMVPCISLTIKNERLSEKAISDLRDQYPICGLQFPEYIDMIQPPLEEIIAGADTFVYGEVVGDISCYSLSTSTDSKELDEKRKSNGILNENRFYEYTLRIISDTEGKYADGDVIKIKANEIFINYNPVLCDGMKIVVPVVKDAKEEKRHDYSVIGMYYVTDEDYAISAFDEKTVTDMRMNGLKVDTLLKKLKK